jgi:hypothetical protein
LRRRIDRRHLLIAGRAGLGEAWSTNPRGPGGDPDTTYVFMRAIRITSILQAFAAAAAPLAGGGSDWFTTDEQSPVIVANRIRTLAKPKRQ